MIEAEGRNENGVLLSAWSVRLVAKRRDVSVARKPKPANQMQPEAMEESS